jgi:hypothetical protein
MLLIARSDNIESIFFVVLQGHEQLAAIAMCKLSIVRSGNKTSMLSMSYCNERATRTNFLRHIARGQTMIQQFKHREDVRDSCECMAWPTTQQSNNIYCRLLEATTMTSIFICRIARKATTIIFLMLQSGCIARSVRRQ